VNEPLWGNHILSELASEDVSLLLPLEPIDLPHGEFIFRAGQAIDQVIFPKSGAISLTVTMNDGSAIEAAMVGREGVLGASAAVGIRRAINDALVQIAGEAYFVPLVRFLNAFACSRALQDAVGRFNAVLLAQAQQAAACNASHSTQARVCRWLLELRDRCGSDVIPLTQDFLAHMVGVQRTTVTLIASKLQAAGVIRCRRGRVQILDVAMLESAACECYGRVKLLVDTISPALTSERGSMKQINPQDVVPLGPALDFAAPHDRGRF
jgi:CRP-like cAMP-binding protein